MYLSHNKIGNFYPIWNKEAFWKSIFIFHWKFFIKSDIFLRRVNTVTRSSWHQAWFHFNTGLIPLQIIFSSPLYSKFWNNLILHFWSFYNKHIIALILHNSKFARHEAYFVFHLTIYNIISLQILTPESDFLQQKNPPTSK